MRRAVLLFLLLAVSAILGLNLREELARPPAVFDPPPAPAGELAPMTAPEIPVLEAPPVEHFSSALDRPLFSPDRRPAIVESEAAPEVDTALTATLQGVMLSDDERVALIRPIGGTEVVRLTEGETLMGWRLRKIALDSVVFERDDEEAVLELIYKATEKPGAPGPRETR